MSNASSIIASSKAAQFAPCGAYETPKPKPNGPTMNFESMMADLFRRQNELNIIAAGPDWVAQKINWSRYIWLECAELLDHCDIYHWKTKTENRDQILLEFVDILHFGLSDLFAKGLLKQTVDVQSTLSWASYDLTDVHKCVERVAGGAIEHGAFSLTWFVAALEAYGSSMDELYRLYIGKCTLNAFRQEFGYKSGTYHRKFSGKDDNVHLAEILATATDVEDLGEYVDFHLRARYVTSAEYLQGGTEAATATIDRKYKIDAVNPITGRRHTDADSVLFLAKDRAFLDILPVYLERCRIRGSNEEHLESIALLAGRVAVHQREVESHVPDTLGAEIGRCVHGRNL